MSSQRGWKRSRPVTVGRWQWVWPWLLRICFLFLGQRLWSFLPPPSPPPSEHCGVHVTRPWSQELMRRGTCASVLRINTPSSTHQTPPPSTASFFFFLQMSRVIIFTGSISLQPFFYYFIRCSINFLITLKSGGLGLRLWLMWNSKKKTKKTKPITNKKTRWKTLTLLWKSVFKIDLWSVFGKVIDRKETASGHVTEY